MKQATGFAIALLLLTALIPTAAFAQEPLACEYIHVVQEGDWLSEIANRYLDDPLAYEAIVAAANAQAEDVFTNIDDPALIEPGTLLCIDVDQLAPEGLSRQTLANAEYKSQWTQSGTAKLIQTLMVYLWVGPRKILTHQVIHSYDVLHPGWRVSQLLAYTPAP